MRQPRDPEAPPGGDEGFWPPVVAATRQLPPPPGEMALATVLGAAAVALINAGSIAVRLGYPASALGPRLSHHLHAAVTHLGVGALLAAPFALAALVGRRLPGRGQTVRAARAAGWSVFGALAIASMGWVVGGQLYRQAHAVLDGRLGPWLFPAYVALAGLGVPAAYVLGAVLGRLAWPGGAFAATGGLVVGHIVLPRDYAGVHTAVLWIAGVLFGASLAPVVGPALRPARRRLVAAVAAAFGATVLLFSPPNTVRLQLFREDGAVSAWVLARAWWRLPPVTAAPRAPVWRPEHAPPRGATRAAVAQRPVVVLLTVDALRADVLTDPETARRLPHLSRVIRRGAYFPHAIAAGSQTSVSLSTMFTGRYFSQLWWTYHGQGASRFLYPANDDTPRFPEQLAAAGVLTASWPSLTFLAGRFGIARGFTEETMGVDGRGHASAAAVLEPLLRRLRSVGPDQPALLFTHLMEPHAPYDRGERKDGTDKERYLSEVALVDRWVGRVVSALQRHHAGRGYLILSADHGEAFGEHGDTLHTKTLYQELIDVPLIVHGPGIAGRRYGERVGLVDVGPTVHELFGLPHPAHSMGQSLLPLLDGRSTKLDRPLAAEGRLKRALVLPDGLKVIDDHVRKTTEVFDLTVDPFELHNLLDVDPARSGPAVATLRAFFEAHTRREPPGYEPPYKP